MSKRILIASSCLERLGERRRLKSGSWRARERCRSFHLWCARACSLAFTPWYLPPFSSSYRRLLADGALCLPEFFPGDIMLAQKIALEPFESEAQSGEPLLAHANQSRPPLSISSSSSPLIASAQCIGNDGGSRHPQHRSNRRIGVARKGKMKDWLL